MEAPLDDPPVDQAFVSQTLISVAGVLRLFQQGIAPNIEEAKELEDRISRILPYVTPRPIPDGV